MVSLKFNDQKDCLAKLNGCPSRAEVAKRPVSLFNTSSPVPAEIPRSWPDGTVASVKDCLKETVNSMVSAVTDPTVDAKGKL